ncbi:hypothetical protein F0Z19_0186 [Vibrio cyclitrophicus]|mgnify:CR=1|nr:hypothetical protein F0Z19_0186 [Vibrio cyclitrophicus]OED87427.1 hypothetical protein OAQ_06485 [Vibrio cyclitrophicus ZF30]OEE18055.1 hypothetical protein OC1_06090 [Vibrio cyclitrophicus ZF207]NOH17510.1 hypothetical protein [Vibrio cyclitrophicus]PME45481.1 hypothetical protein BCV36_00560 [Vibrio cyclitrophicus]
MLVVLGIVAIGPAKTQDPRPKTQDPRPKTVCASFHQRASIDVRIVRIVWFIWIGVYLAQKKGD